MTQTRLFIIAALVLVLDQATKFTIKWTMALRESIPLIGDTFRLTYIENYGMAFGISIGNKLLFNGFSIIAAGAIFYFFLKMKEEHKLPRIALAVILGGAIGNLSDRLIYGRVVDFFDLNIPDIPAINLWFINLPPMTRWPIFNIADIAVSVGMFVLMASIVTSDSDWYDLGAEEKSEETPADPEKINSETPSTVEENK